MRHEKSAVLVMIGTFVLSLHSPHRPVRAQGEDGYRAATPAATGVKRPEDLVRVPGTKWVVASSMRGDDGDPGALYAIDSSVASPPVKLYPAESATNELDETRFRDCPGPPDARQFFPHGLNVRQLKDAGVELYVVNHGGRESIEVFHITLSSRRPRARWVGCVRLPDHVFGNSIAPLPDGGFVVTNMYDPSDPSLQSKLATGKPTGNVKRWKPESGWSNVVSQPLSGANGVEVAPDGSRLYVTEWAARKLWAFDLNGNAATKSIDVEFLPDNLRWTERGTLLLAGQNTQVEKLFGGQASPFEFTVAEIDPAQLRMRVLVKGGDKAFDAATGAIFVGPDLWVGSFRGETIGRFVPTAGKGGR